MPADQTPLTRDFLLRTLQLNTDNIIKAFTSHLGEMSRRVEDNSTQLKIQGESINRHEKALDQNKTELSKINARLSAIERGAPGTSDLPVMRAQLRAESLVACRSLRIWPIPGISDNEMWGNVGEFIHGPLGVPEADICQDDIEMIKRAWTPENGVEGGRDEVIVTMKDKKSRDLLMVSSVNLADRVDAAGRPTAGTRIEVPDELKDTLRLLNRFGARLRSRHGPGTKRHVKFDEFAGSLFCNVKLPGDESWTRVTPQMAREDLGASVREENTKNQKRLASKLIPWPRELLARPMPAPTGARDSTGTGPATETRPDGVRPRWRSSGPTSEGRS